MTGHGYYVFAKSPCPYQGYRLKDVPYPDRSEVPIRRIRSLYVHRPIGVRLHFLSIPNNYDAS